MRIATLILFAAFLASCGANVPIAENKQSDGGNQLAALDGATNIANASAAAGTGAACSTVDRPSFPDSSITCSVCKAVPGGPASYQNMLCRNGQVKKVGTCRFPTIGSCKVKPSKVCAPYADDGRDPDGSRIALPNERVCFMVGRPDAYQFARCTDNGSFELITANVRGNDPRCVIKLAPSPYPGRAIYN
jgi:hypothetical protein